MALLPSGVVAANTVASGSCGANLTWKLDSDGVLTISGTGEMDDYYDASSEHWYDRRESIKTVIISGGVTSIGSNAFSSCSSLTYVYYGGNQAQWGAINIRSNNDKLLYAYYHSVG